MKLLPLIIALLLVSSCNVNEKLGFTEKTRIPVQNNNPSHCQKWQSGEVVTITESTTIPKGCNYDKVSFLIKSSNIVFDCNKSILNGLGKTKRNSPVVPSPYKRGDDPVVVAFNIVGSENNLIQDITVKNCDLRYYVNGFNVSLSLNKTTHDDLKNNRNVTALENHLRTLSPKNIRIENTQITGSHKAGIFVQRYINGLTIDKTNIVSAGDIGVYLESGTQNITISNSSFRDNGKTTYDIEKRLRKSRVKPREAIAVDSSSHNKIVNNRFSDNGGGAIFIYKNCYERYKEAEQLPRYQQSNFNTIQNNLFKDERRGVWIASRQDRDLDNFDCGDPLVFEDKNEKYYEDFAKYTRILNNTFEDVKEAIIVEDDNSTISGNTFKGESERDIRIGTRIRTKILNRPVTGTTVENNTFNSNAEPHVLIKFDSKNNTFNNNTPPVSISDSTRS